MSSRAMPMKTWAKGLGNWIKRKNCGIACSNASNHLKPSQTLSEATKHHAFQPSQRTCADYILLWLSDYGIRKHMATLSRCVKRCVTTKGSKLFDASLTHFDALWAPDRLDLHQCRERRLVQGFASRQIESERNRNWVTRGIESRYNDVFMMYSWCINDVLMMY